MFCTSFSAASVLRVSGTLLVSLLLSCRLSYCRNLICLTRVVPVRRYALLFLQDFCRTFGDAEMPKSSIKSLHDVILGRCSSDLLLWRNRVTTPVDKLFF
ncbi:hypothetical protein PAHAL_3G070400 [Panicum hallii]|uniref:Uncharacterized protein n=1 Tax=Panicum hallii TaxID=206008 RepID=A0A2T8KHF1_9POAL|nr:hypothetical protein PAHAL_3G070400 [Panicum hallii]